MSDKCSVCEQPIVYGKDWMMLRGQKIGLEKLEADGKTPHKCKPKVKEVRAAQKPREEFEFSEYIKEDGKNRQYTVRRTGFVGELRPDTTFAEMEMAVWKYLASKQGNPKVVQKE